MKTQLPQRYAARIYVNEITGCWEWTSTIRPDGYPIYSLTCGCSKRAHRWMYEYLKEPIPEGMVLDHLCRVRHCVNPDHLEVVTRGENTRRGDNWLRHKTHCPKGHPYSGENLMINSRGSRECRICKRASKNRCMKGKSNGKN